MNQWYLVKEWDPGKTALAMVLVWFMASRSGPIQDMHWLNQRIHQGEFAPSDLLSVPVLIAWVALPVVGIAMFMAYNLATAKPERRRPDPATLPTDQL